MESMENIQKSKSSSDASVESKSSIRTRESLAQRKTSTISEKISLKSGVNVESADEFFKAKAFLMTASTVTDTNLYEHLTELIGQILEGRPKNVVDYIEELSIWLKKSKLQYKDDTLTDAFEYGPKYLQARKDKKLFQGGIGDVSSVDEDEDEMTEELPPVEVEGTDNVMLLNLQEEMYFLGQAGLTLNRNEVYRISLSLKPLLRQYPLENLRFWGKIIGMERNYIIVEANLKAGEEFGVEKTEDEAEEEPDFFDGNSRILMESISVTKQPDDDDEPPLPKPKIRPPLVVGSEPFREGANAKIYFVTVSPDFNWIKLPLVTPAQISSARIIRKYFTGRLDAPVLSYPPFPGKEINLLRAQIARISAATLVSPLGWFVTDTENDGIIVNENFEEVPSINLVQDVLGSWVHHSAYLLPQGRCTWTKPARPAAASSGEEEAENVEEEKSDAAEEEIEPETGPPLFSPLSDDFSHEGIDLWTARMSPSAFPQFAVAAVQSLLWPGAYAVAKQKKLANVYIGYGVKFAVTSYNPAPPPPIMTEYPQNGDIVEMMDPAPDEEAVYKQVTEGPSENEGEEEEGDD